MRADRAATNQTVDAPPAPEWGALIGQHVLAGAREAVTTKSEAARVQAAFLALVAADAPAWLERLVLYLEVHSAAFNYSLRRPAVRSDRVGDGLAVRTVNNTAANATASVQVTGSFGGSRPGLRVLQHRHGCDQLDYPGFVSGDGGELLVMVAGGAMGPEDAARAFVHPCLQALDLVHQEAADVEQRQRMVRDSRPSPGPARLLDVTARRLTVDDAAPADLAAVAAVDEACFSQPWTAAMYRSGLRAGGVLFVAEPSAGAIAGFALGSAQAHEFEIIRIAVRPDQQRQGMGAGLLHAALTHADTRTARRVIVDIERDNAAVHQFYARAGFVVEAGR